MRSTLIALAASVMLTIPVAASADSDTPAGRDDKAHAEQTAAVPGVTTALPAHLARLYREDKRPAMLPALYVSLGVLNAFDLYTTARALDNGGREVNPAMAPFAGKPGAAIALKAATMVGTVYFAERLWKKNRVAAIALLIAVNGATAAVAAHNARNAGR